ncbi:hypothetical protein COOONC_10919 [Cooperia oncophora]
MFRLLDFQDSLLHFNLLYTAHTSYTRLPFTRHMCDNLCDEATMIPIPPLLQVPKILTPFEEVEESERAAHQQLESLLFEAEVMLREYEHLKQGLRA